MKNFAVVENLLIIAPAGSLSVTFQRFSAIASSCASLGYDPNAFNRWNYTDNPSVLSAYQ